ncbi:endonuclease/exonuclease/phosphatase family protein [Pseudomonas panipatensis]|uniref:Metal-dependent hydrolase, endonuclease/exonuclease/phosphatase family n=1 Tax=Pseudomonas panipatensis TaxID=428992 RepID=A0A1G8EG02_9PSED|nr:endonuclease/exonuclease/phosphatase family protein [Pseudomonas panipatensis]SDH68862.1 Metal-dependent hydrolase, endonuclease/exonuclease/phosphatase family [Pseudomonas panipatensis]SMP67808.1 Metal-dependent hydrolase, endonuclease/exonuclease/phosphatase family [Pseudomonas panipatensis]
MNLPRTLRIALSLSVSLLAALAALAWLLAWHPPAREAVAAQCRATAAELPAGQPLKVMTWNLQYLAGKRYVFWNDLPDASGPDERPTAADLANGLDEVVRVIRDENPDVLLLQEVDDGAAATDWQDQQALLAARLADLYPCSAAAFDWKVRFDPNPHVLGSQGRKLVTFSRYRIASAERLALPRPSQVPLLQAFAPQPALLSVRLAGHGGQALNVLNTWLSRSDGHSDTAQRQVSALLAHLQDLQAGQAPWLLGGDFGLLPLGQYPYLPEPMRAAYRPNSELNLLAARYPVIPALQEASGTGQEHWYSFFPNDPRVSKPDRTLDFFFHTPRLTRLDAFVRRADTLRISTHLPLVARFRLAP